MMLSIIVTIVSIFFIGIGCYSYQRREVFWFWSTTDNGVERIAFRDVKAFNHRVGIMWILFGLLLFFPIPFLFSGILKENVCIMLLSCILTIGLLSMMFYWHHLYHVYRL